MASGRVSGIVVRRKRILIIGLVLFGLIGASLIYIYFIQTSVAIREAESFLFRRPNVARIDDEGQYRHFWVTNRAISEDRAPLDERFGRSRTTDLSYGIYETSLSHSLSLGMLINPTDWFQSEQITVDAVEQLPGPDFLAEVRRMSMHRHVGLCSWCCTAIASSFAAR
ncbi:MAG: hypothetical protein AAGE01_12945 [Pseudomonadota bacterium]